MDRGSYPGTYPLLVIVRMVMDRRGINFPTSRWKRKEGRRIARDDRRHIRTVSSREIYEGYFKFIKIFVFPVVA